MSASDTEKETYVKIPREELVRQLRLRDGDTCQHPSCNNRMDFSLTDGPHAVTIDHWYPQYAAKSEGWPMSDIWAVNNLKLMEKKCNADKGDRIPFEDGTLPAKPARTFRYRRQARAGRPEYCTECDNGHNLTVGEVCANCNCTAQRFPRDAKVRYSECDHEIFWCWSCSIGVTPRPPAIDIAVRQGESGEW